MKVITLINQKGGAGKTTLARALLSAADEEGLRAAFIDCDQTENLSKWAFRASQKSGWSDRIEGFQTLDAQEASGIVEALEDQGKTELVIVDTAGDASSDHDVFVGLADLVLIPVFLTESDIEIALGTAQYLFRLRQRVDDPGSLPNCRVVLNKLSTRPSRSDHLLLERIQNEKLVGDGSSEPVEKLTLLSAVLQDREAYKIMDKQGLLGRVLKRHNQKAIDENKRFTRNPKYLVNCLEEAKTLLSLCMQEGQKDG